MAKITFKGNPVNTNGILPSINSKAPNFSLVRKDLSEATLDTYEGKKKILNIVVSFDTEVCAISFKNFQKKLADVNNIVLLHISADLPFAQGRFCSGEGIPTAEVLSTFRSDFAQNYGVEIIDGPLKGLCARAVVVLDENNKVIYTELVPEIAQEPNYDRSFESLEATLM